jgi:predicted permease
MGTVTIEGREEMEDPDANPVHAGNWVSSGYFETMGLTVREGQAFSQEHMIDYASPIIVNRTMAERYWPEGGAVGSRIQLRSPFDPDNPSPWLDIVGVADDLKAWGLRDDPDRFQFHMPITQRVRSDGVLTVRTSAEAADIIPLVQQQIWSVDPRLPTREAYPIRDRLMGSVARERFNATLLAAFASLGLFLAVVGVYGVISLAVGQRTREIGIRVALGAGRAGIVRTVMGRTLWAVGAGLILGLGLALVLTRFIEGLLFQVETNDPATYLTVGSLMIAVAFAACVLPARKAVSVDPREALQEE